jgi:L-sorbose 1-phosphate reductase (EC 1.1.1.-)
MKTTALRLYGTRDLRLETFDLPEMQEDEILATVVTDSLCLSSWKEANLGENHKKSARRCGDQPHHHRP